MKCIICKKNIPNEYFWCSLICKDKFHLAHWSTLDCTLRMRQDEREEILNKNSNLRDKEISERKTRLSRYKPYEHNS